MKTLLTQILLFFATSLTFSINQIDGYQIKIKLENYSESELSLAYYYGDKQYIKETVQADANGFFTFANNESINGGIYLIVMKPNNNFLQILITESEKNFTVYANAQDLAKGIRFENAPDNTLLYEYIGYLNEMQLKSNKLNDEIKLADEEMKKKLGQELDNLDKMVKTHQEKIIKNNPHLFSAAIIKANMPLDIPDFKGTTQEKEIKKQQFYKKHFFDNIALNDVKMLRTPFLFQKVDSYVTNFTIQHPDSISKSIDFILDKMKPSEETFKYYLIHFLNYYAKSKFVGMDAVYVHLGINYYEKGLAPWTEQKQLEMIIENAKILEPLLIGKKAPNLKLQSRDGNPTELHQLEGKYIILYFWRDDSDKCKKSTPFLKNIHKKFNNLGVQIVAICSKSSDEVSDCWKYVDENEIMNWMHLADPYQSSRFKEIYNILTTPQIYILGPDKSILSKRIGAEQLEEVLEVIIKK